MRRLSAGLELPKFPRSHPLEDVTDVDADRRIDEGDFRRHQFDIFKNEYREAFDEHGHVKLANLVLDANLKKEVINTLRKLQKAQFNLQSGPGKEEMKDLISKMKEIHDELALVSKGDIEFTMDNVGLPEYDELAVELFFGKEEASKTSGILSGLCGFNERFVQKINEVLGAAQLLMTEYEEYTYYLKKAQLVGDKVTKTE